MAQKKFVEEGIKLEFKHTISYRKLIDNHEIDEIIMKMCEYVGQCGAKPKRSMTITKGLNFETGKQLMDMEFKVEANQPIKGNNIYQYQPSFVLENCVCSKYIGHPQNANMATKEVQTYIQKHELKPISAVHQVLNNMGKVEKAKNKGKDKKKNEINLEAYIAVK